MRDKVFISYSHEDRKWLKRLRVHLRPLERDQNIEIWDDTRITPGDRWRKEIRSAIESTQVAVLLISADFLASDFITTDELPPLLEAAEKDGAVILSIILSPSRFLRAPILSQFQTVNDPAKPLIGLSKLKQEALWLQLAETVETNVQQDLKERSSIRNSETIACQALSQTTAAIFVDIMRLLYVVSGDAIRKANISSYSKFVRVLTDHFQDLDARIAGYATYLN